MKKCNILSIGCVVLLAILFTTSCERLPLYDEIGNLQLDIKIDYDIKHTDNIKAPEVMYVGLYDNVSNKFIRNEYTGPEGGEIFADPRAYHILVYNFDTEATLIRGIEDIHTVEAYTNVVPTRVSQEYRAAIRKIKEKKMSPSRVSQYEGQPIINEPDHLFAGVDFDVNVPIRSEIEQMFTIHADASTLLDTYALTIGPVKGLDYIKEMEVFITGQAQSKFIANRQIAGEPATLYVPVNILQKNSRDADNYIKTTFRTFGKYPGADNKIYLIVKLTDFDDNITLVETDITDQFDDPDNTDDEIKVEQEIVIEEQGEGLVPTVNIWTDNVTNIYIK